MAPFTYINTGYAIVALGTIAVYGWLLERRHGPALVLVLFAIAAVGGAAVTAADSTLPLALGANGGALALLIAWAIPDLLALRAGEEIDGDLLGTAVIAVVVALMPLAGAGGELGRRRGRRARRGSWSGCRWRSPASAEATPRSAPGPPTYDQKRPVVDRAYTDAELEAAIAAIADPERLREAQELVARTAPALQRVLAAALDEGGWFDSAHSQAVQEATGLRRSARTVRAVQTMLAEETRLGMLVGVAVGFELARELGGRSQTTEED